MTGAPSSSIPSLAQGVLDGSTRSVARLLRSIDDRSGSYRESLIALYPHTGRAHVIGITGNPGAGKSTLTDQLVAMYRARKQRVGVIAVDPTSPFTGGAILGDRIRMQRHATDPEVFIRSLATRGHLGGVSRSTADSVHVLDAWGAHVVIVETVGVGQDELDVARLAHTTLVVASPGMGDEIQAIKAGILEIADVFAVNKADRDGADATVRDLEAMIAMGHEIFHARVQKSSHHGLSRQRMHETRDELMAQGEWLPPIVKTVAHRGEGISDLGKALEQHRLHLQTTGQGKEREFQRIRDELIAIVSSQFHQQLFDSLGAIVEASVEKILAHASSPYEQAQALLQHWRTLTPPNAEISGQAS